MSDELIPSEGENPETEGEYIDDSSVSHRLLDYINTKKGDAMLARVVAMVEQIAPAAKTLLEAKAEIQKGNPTLEYRKWWWLLIVRFLVVTAALGSAIYLKSTNNLDSTTSIIIVTIATVFFSFGRKDGD